jgi:hypothetical protein
MSSEKIIQIASSIKLPVDDPLFPERIFTLVARERKSSLGKDDNTLEKICSEEYDALSRRADLSKLQDSCSIRNVIKTRRLANFLVQDNGEILFDRIPMVLQHLKDHLASLGPNRQFDTRRNEHIMRALTYLIEHKEAQRLLKNITKPYHHRHADQIIRDTLRLAANVVVNDAHARRAVLSAWLCYLRQNVGSCFATAPAIIVQSEQPEVFLKDLNEILGTGSLKRTFGGIEYSVPLSISWGAGDLKRVLVLEMGEALERSDLWLSPGLLEAFETIEIIDSQAPLKQKSERARELILDALKAHYSDRTYFVITPEELIRKVILQHLKITEKEIQDYLNRPKGMMQSSLVMQVSTTNRNQVYAKFETMKENAESAFNGLADNALLKSWEFTIASFAETKAQFTRWNLYSSLGMGAQEVGGIGHSIYEILQHKLDYYNRQAQDLQTEYELKYGQLKYLEGRVRSASTEKELQWIKVEYQSHLNEFYTLEEMRDTSQAKAKQISGMFEALIDTYYDLFPRYFQEVYDADMQMAIGQYDDSPAGFRLIYKHGRANTSQWTYVRSPDDFIDALSNFFIVTETEILSMHPFKGFEHDVSEIVTAIVTHIKTVEFLETAFYRMAAVHKTPIVKNPLENLDKIEKKPWAYTSGGTMGSLVSCYFGREQLPTDISRWVENPMELFVFLVDTIKQIPPKLSESYIRDPSRALLMHSPTHAFLFRAGFAKFREAVMQDALSYIWIRDQIVKPMERAIDRIVLDEEKMNFLINLLASNIPESFRFYFKKVFSHIHGEMSAKEFREFVVETMEKENGLTMRESPILAEEEIDSRLYEYLPLLPVNKLSESLKEILRKLPNLPSDIEINFSTAWENVSTSTGEQFVTSQTLQNICKAFLNLILEKTSSSIDYSREIARVAIELDLALPAPVSFADTNWVHDDFAFVVNPGSGKLELWRFDPSGRHGRPMVQWNQWLNGSRKDIPWGIYTRPHEYIFS